MDWTYENEQEQKLYERLGENEGYTNIECPNCNRMRVEHWSGGKDICEKCHWCIQDKRYYNELIF